MFGLHFVHKVSPDLFEENEWEFLKGEVVASGDAGGMFPTWAAPDRKDEFGMLAATLPRVVNYLNLSDGRTWEPWSTSVEAEKELPDIAK
jgi:hypothetical protein